MMIPTNDNSAIQVVPSSSPIPPAPAVRKSDSDDVFVGENVCESHEHGGKMALNDVFGLDVDYMFELLFTDSQFYRDFLASRKTTELIQTPWPVEFDEDGSKSRLITYTLSLNYKIGPKSTKTTEKQTILPESKPGSHYIVDAEVHNLEVPYADTFYTITRFCLLKESNNKTRLKVHCEVKYRKQAWGPIKVVVGKCAQQGLPENFNLLAVHLRREADRNHGSTTSNNNNSMNNSTKKKLRKRHKQQSQSIASSFERPAHMDASRYSSQPLAFSLSANTLALFLCFIIILLIFLNVFLFLKISQLESQTLLFYRNSEPSIKTDWRQLIDDEENIYKTQSAKWKKVLSSSLLILDQIKTTMQTLYKRVEEI
ncbi:DgyrCDS11585 [Dimorphilus gyrociliatus]|uniref:DgyrCDS11585 n=1 Tax=Dimorphilus gyrociliatus TaxID=2664684 RepID=A0A7I8W6C2_9ANNE|nr:DgyrCDS11585 [Dimorphilus gyrociliatus]